MFGQYSKTPPSCAWRVSRLTVNSLVSKCQGCSRPGATTLRTSPESGSASSCSCGSPKQRAMKSLERRVGVEPADEGRPWGCGRGRRTRCPAGRSGGRVVRRQRRVHRDVVDVDGLDVEVRLGGEGRALLLQHLAERRPDEIRQHGAAESREFAPGTGHHGPPLGTVELRQGVPGGVDHLVERDGLQSGHSILSTCGQTVPSRMPPAGPRRRPGRPRQAIRAVRAPSGRAPSGSSATPLRSSTVEVPTAPPVLSVIRHTAPTPGLHAVRGQGEGARGDEGGGPRGRGGVACVTVLCNLLHKAPRLVYNCCHDTAPGGPA